MFHIAVCDDNHDDLRTVIRYLSELRHPSFHIECLPFTNGADLIREYQNNNHFNLIILDMLMEPINGMLTAQSIRKFDDEVPILIVTATMEFAVDGYQVDARRYILKPVDKNNFLKEVKNIINRSSDDSKNYFSFNSDNGLSKISLHSIYYFESNIRTVKICTTKQNHLFTAKISDIEETLKDFEFIRIHKSYIVNLRHVRNIFKDVITMDNGEQLPLSKHKSKEVREKFLSYMRDII